MLLPTLRDSSTRRKAWFTNLLHNLLHQWGAERIERTSSRLGYRSGHYPRTLAEMYIQGVSTRKVKEITGQLCGHEFSAATVSRINQSLDPELAKFAHRRLEEEYPYLVLDARYEKGCRWSGGSRRTPWRCRARRPG